MRSGLHPFVGDRVVVPAVIMEGLTYLETRECPSEPAGACPPGDLLVGLPDPDSDRRLTGHHHADNIDDTTDCKAADATDLHELHIGSMIVSGMAHTSG